MKEPAGEASVNLFFEVGVHAELIAPSPGGLSWIATTPGLGLARA
jgi:hypothetical protein